MRILARRNTRLSLLAAAVLVAVTGCGSLNPGAAAVVGSTNISHEEVDDVARALCAANISGAEAQGQPPPELPSRGARQSAVQVLVDTELSQQFGEARGVEASRRQVSQALAQNEQGLALLPADRRADFEHALEEYAEGQLMLIEIGRSSLEEQGQSEVSNDQALAEGQRLRNEWVESIDVEVDPRYGSFAEGTVQAGGTSLSVPASDDARAADSANPSQTFVSALPESQKCS